MVVGCEKEKRQSQACVVIVDVVIVDVVIVDLVIFDVVIVDVVIVDVVINDFVIVDVVIVDVVILNSKRALLGGRRPAGGISDELGENEKLQYVDTLNRALSMRNSKLQVLLLHVHSNLQFTLACANSNSYSLLTIPSNQCSIGLKVP